MVSLRSTVNTLSEQFIYVQQHSDYSPIMINNFITILPAQRITLCYSVTILTVNSADPVYALKMNIKYLATYLIYGTKGLLHFANITPIHGPFHSTRYMSPRLVPHLAHLSVTP